MLLSARVLEHCYNVNAFEPALQLSFTEGDAVTVYLQLIDATKDLQNKPLPGKRYVPATGATLTVTIKSVDNLKTLTKLCVNPFVNDTSIFSFQIASTDALKGTASLQLTLTEGLVVTNGRVDTALMVRPLVSAYL